MYIGIADYTFSITLLTKASNSNSWLLPAHNQIRMMLGHDLFKILVFLRAPAGIDLRLCCFSFSTERGKPGETSALYDFLFFILLLFLNSGFILILFMKFLCISCVFVDVPIICLIYCQTEKKILLQLSSQICDSLPLCLLNSKKWWLLLNFKASYILLISVSGINIALLNQFSHKNQSAYHLFDILSNWKILLQIFNFLQDSSFSIFDSLLFYFFPTKRFLLNISNLKLNLLKYTRRVHVSRLYGFNSIFFYWSVCCYPHQRSFHFFVLASLFQSHAWLLQACDWGGM